MQGQIRDFLNGILLDESLTEEGNFNDNLCREWDKNGNMVRKVTEDYSCEWFDNGNLKEKSISADRGYAFSIIFSEPQKLRYLTFYNDYPFDVNSWEPFAGQTHYS